MCLEVQSAHFSPSSCGNGAVASNIWIYACVNAEAEPQAEERERSADCPLHENVMWKLTGKLVRSAVPAGSAHSTGTIPWDTCLTSTDSFAPLKLAVCNETDPRQHWTVFSAANNSYFQLRQGGKCVSSMPLPSPPAPPPLPVPSKPPVANLFHDQQGSEIVVITSPGVEVNGTVEVTVRGAAHRTTPTAKVIRPGEAKPSLLTSVRLQSEDVVVITVALARGAAVVQLG